MSKFLLLYRSHKVTFSNNDGLLTLSPSMLVKYAQASSTSGNPPARTQHQSLHSDKYFIQYK